MHPPLGTTGGNTKYFPDMVAYMDEVVGRVVDSVDELGLTDNTLILFYGDNGTDRRVISQTTFGQVVGGKGNTKDAGTHVPLIARWPGRVKPGINDDLIDSTDFLPTIMAAAGRSVPKDVPIDGRSFYPQLMGQAGSPREWVFCHYDPRPGWDKDKFRMQRFARDKRFKLYGDGQLFDVPADLLETEPIPAGDDSKQSAAARKALQAVLDSMPAPEPKQD